MSWFSWIFRRREPNPVAKVGAPLGLTTIEDRSLGCLLGVACGDILGANVEKVSREEIKLWHGRVHNFLDSAGRPYGHYTDDTEMTLALASSLVTVERIDGAHCSSNYAKFFARPPARGYGRATKQVLEALNEGADYRYTGTLMIPTGSYANGGVMRIAPVGIAFRNAPDVVLYKAVKIALQATHVHPEGIDGAWLQAKIVGWLVKIEPKHFNSQVFLNWLQTVAKTEASRASLIKLERALREGWSTEKLLEEACAPDENGKVFQIRAVEALTCALWSFIQNYKDPEECIVQAVGLGGDSDTIGAIAGAQAGALHGTDWIPKRWYDNIENKPETGRDVIMDVARQLSKIDFRQIEEVPWPPNKSPYVKNPIIKPG